LRRREGCGTIRPHVALLRAQTDVENVDHHTHPAPARREVPFTKLRSRFRSAALVAERRAPARSGWVGEFRGRFEHP
jgi:hypothetical protein